jgi:hypothetical protein
MKFKLRTELSCPHNTKSDSMCCHYPNLGLVNDLIANPQKASRNVVNRLKKSVLVEIKRQV